MCKILVNKNFIKFWDTIQKKLKFEIKMTENY